MHHTTTAPKLQAKLTVRYAKVFNLRKLSPGVLLLNLAAGILSSPSTIIYVCGLEDASYFRTHTVVYNDYTDTNNRA